MSGLVRPWRKLVRGARKAVGRQPSSRRLGSARKLSCAAISSVARGRIAATWSPPSWALSHSFASRRVQCSLPRHVGGEGRFKLAADIFFGRKVQTKIRDAPEKLIVRRGLPRSTETGRPRCRRTVCPVATRMTRADLALDPEHLDMGRAGARLLQIARPRGRRTHGMAAHQGGYGPRDVWTCATLWRQGSFLCRRTRTPTRSRCLRWSALLGSCQGPVGGREGRR